MGYLLTPKGHGKLGEDGRDIISMDCGSGYKSVYICQNSLNFTFQKDTFICMKIIPQ